VVVPPRADAGARRAGSQKVHVIRRGPLGLVMAAPHTRTAALVRRMLAAVRSEVHARPPWRAALARRVAAPAADARAAAAAA
jgi:hypothetical protein